MSPRARPLPGSEALQHPAQLCRQAFDDGEARHGFDHHLAQLFGRFAGRSIWCQKIVIRAWRAYQGFTEKASEAIKPSRHRSTQRSQR